MKLTTFEHGMFGTLRAVVMDDQPWFLLADVAKALGFQRAEKAKKHLHDSQFNTPNRGIASELGLSGGKLPTVINESGLYQLIMRANTENARKFQDWVTGEVLPTIRQKGSYDMGADDAPAYMREFMAKANEFFEYAAPRARAHDEVHATSGGYGLNETARRMGTTHHTLTAALRSRGVLDSRCRPTEFGLSSGLIAKRPGADSAVVPEDSYETLRGFVLGADISR